MKAQLIFRQRVVFGDRDVVEAVIWNVPVPVPPSGHSFKYRLVYIVDGARVVGFDNERGKGDHRHENGVEFPYVFRGVDLLRSDFLEAVRTWRERHGKV